MNLYSHTPSLSWGIFDWYITVFNLCICCYNMNCGLNNSLDSKININKIYIIWLQFDDNYCN